MSIWSSFFSIDAAYRVDYRLGEPGEPYWVDVADARSWYGRTGLRLVVADTSDIAAVVLDRRQVTDLRDALTGWLDETEETE